jgi:hypothetical protein
MKKSKLIQLIKEVITEQKYTEKDPGACAEKTLMSLYPSVYQALVTPWVGWMASIDQGSTNNSFMIEGTLVEQVVTNYFLNANGSFSDNYFTMNPAEGSLIQQDQLEEPYCPYGYINNATIVIKINDVPALAGNFTSFDDLMATATTSNLDVFIEMWSNQTQGTLETGGIVTPSNWMEFIEMINWIDNQGNYPVEIMYQNQLMINMCNCEWSTFIVGCMNPSACNYNPEANEEGGCDFTSCQGCMDDLACDYDPTATISTPCQDYESCVGCMDPDALNYDPNATIQPDDSSASGICQYEGETTEPDTDPIRDKIPNKKPRPDSPASNTGGERPERPITLGGDENLTGGPVQYGITACNPNSAFFSCQVCCLEIAQANADGASMYSEECGCSGIDYPVNESLVKRFKKLANIKKKK